MLAARPTRLLGAASAARPGGRAQWRQRQQQRQPVAAALQVQQLECDLAAEELAEGTALSAAAQATMQQQPEQQAAAGAEEQPQTRGGALSLVAAGGAEQEVPRTLRGALATFFSHPSSLLILAGIAALLYWRAQLPGGRPGADAAVAAAVAAGWCVQEWAVHALLLHSKRDWLGKRIHEGHHQRGYFHVSIDDPPIVLAFMAGALLLFCGGTGGSELGVTAAATYFAMGLAYEWTHFVVHTRYLPRTKLGKAIRQHHMLHHTRHEGYWLAFIVPQVDQLFGTAPPPGSVRMSDMARATLKSARGG